MRRTLGILVILGASGFFLLITRDHWNHPALVLQTAAAALCFIACIVLIRGIGEPEPKPARGKATESPCESRAEGVADQIAYHHTVLQFLRQVEERRRVRLERDVTSEW